MTNNWINRLFDAWDADVDDPEGFVTIRDKMGMKNRADRPGDIMFQIQSIPEEWWWKNLTLPLFKAWAVMPYLMFIALGWWSAWYTDRGRAEDGSMMWDYSQENMNWVKVGKMPSIDGIKGFLNGFGSRSDQEGKAESAQA